MHPLHRQHTAATEDGECLSALIGKGVVKDRDTAQLVCRILHENFTVTCKGEKIIIACARFIVCLIECVLRYTLSLVWLLLHHNVVANCIPLVASVPIKAFLNCF